MNGLPNVLRAIAQAAPGEDFVFMGREYRKVWFVAGTFVSCNACPANSSRCGLLHKHAACYHGLEFRGGSVRGVALVDSIPGLVIRGVLRV